MAVEETAKIMPVANAWRQFNPKASPTLAMAAVVNATWLAPMPRISRATYNRTGFELQADKQHQDHAKLGHMHRRSSHHIQQEGTNDDARQ